MTALQIPTLRTARLRLEPLAARHSRGMFELWSREEVCRYSGSARDAEGQLIALPASNPTDSDRILDFFVRRAEAGLGFRWAMITEVDEVFIGALGFNHLGACPELAWHLHPDAWGKGFMMEACREALAWLADASQVQAFIDPANTASIRMAERLGFRETDDMAEGARRYVSAP